MPEQIQVSRGTSSMKTAVILGGLFGAIFCAAGLGMGYFGVSRLIQRGTSQGFPLVAAGLAFAGFGAGVLALLIVGARRTAAEETRQSAHPNEPWLWREDWAEGKVRSSTKSEAWALWGFALLWNVISAPLAMFLPAEILDKQNYAALLGALFPLVGVGLLVAAVRLTIRQRKFGTCLFRMDSVPGVLGGDVSGAILARGEIAADAGTTLQLSCVNRIRTGSGKSRSTTEHILWQHEEPGIRPTPGPTGEDSLLPVRFQVPYDAKPTDSTDPDNAILWRLSAQAAVSGVDFKADFEIPVFATSASSSEATEEHLRAEELAAEVDHPAFTPESGITVLPGQGGGTEFRLARGRESTGVVSLAGFVAIWTGVVALISYAGAPSFFQLVFGAIDLLLLLILLFVTFGECRVAVESGELSVRSTLFGLTTGRRIPCSSIARISVTDASSVSITQRDGKQLSVWWVFKRRLAAEWLADEIRKAVAPWRDAGTSVAEPGPAPGPGG
jgi:hypothetical protein